LLFCGKIKVENIRRSTMSLTERDKLLQEVYDMAYDYEKKYGGCSQAVLGAIKTITGKISDEEYKAATGLAGGIGLKGYACGALTGGTMAISSFLGREYNNMADPEGKKAQTFKLARRLADKFEEYYGSGKCSEINKELFGKSFRLWIREEYEEFDSMGAHEDKCTSVCGNSARWTMEILLDEGLYTI
jgi:C_GCAxxG_C_C family probable redox protein